MKRSSQTILFNALRARASLGLHRDARFLFWGMFFWDFGFGLYMAFFTLYIRELGASDFRIGVLIAIQGIIRILITIPAGILGDRFDRRWMIVLTTGATIPAVLIYGVSQVWWHMLIGMAIMIVGNFGTPALSSYISDVAEGRDRARAFAMIYTVGPASAMILSPTIGGLIAEAASIRAIFFVSAASFLVSTIVMTRITTRPHREHHGQLPSYGEVIREGSFRAIAVMNMLVLGLMMVGATFLPNYLEDIHGFDIGTIGRFYSIASIGSVVLSLLIGRISAISGARGIAVGMLTMGALCGVVLLTGNPWIVAGAFLGRGGFMVAWSLFPAVIGEMTSERLRIRAFAAADFMAGIGVGLAPFLAGALYSSDERYPLLLVAGIAPLLAVLMLFVESRFVKPTAARLRAEQVLAGAD